MSYINPELTQPTYGSIPLAVVRYEIPFPLECLVWYGSYLCMRNWMRTMHPKYFSILPLFRIRSTHFWQHAHFTIESFILWIELTNIISTFNQFYQNLEVFIKHKKNFLTVIAIGFGVAGFTIGERVSISELQSRHPGLRVLLVRPYFFVNIPEKRCHTKQFWMLPPLILGDVLKTTPSRVY